MASDCTNTVTRSDHCWCFESSFKDQICQKFGHTSSSSSTFCKMAQTHLRGYYRHNTMKFAGVQGANCSGRKWHCVTRLTETAHHMAQDKSAHWPRDSTFKRWRMIASAAFVWIWVLSQENMLPVKINDPISKDLGETGQRRLWEILSLYFSNMYCMKSDWYHMFDIII